MNLPIIQSASQAPELGRSPAGAGGTGGPETGLVGEFERLMEGLVASSADSHRPSLVSELARVPAAAVNGAMTSLQTPAPADMPIAEAMRFYAQKHVELSEAKTLQSLAAAAAKLVRKSVETVINNK